MKRSGGLGTAAFARLRHRGRWGVIPTLLATLLGMFAPVVPVAPAQALGAYIIQGTGRDSCDAPSLAEMQAFWTYSTAWYWGIYIGGSKRSCKTQANLSAAWIKAVTSGSMAWRLLPIWVGPQDPCQLGGISYDVNTAYTQGRTEAASAYNAAINLGLTSNTVIVYDMEYTGGAETAACSAAVKSFVNGWVSFLHVAPAQKAGVYTSSKYGNLGQYSTIANVPDFIWGASHDGIPSVRTMPGLSSGLWVYSQRHKQYLGPHYETLSNGAVSNRQVDTNCGNGPVAGPGGYTNPGSVCL